MERLSDRALEILNDLHRERLAYNSEYLPLVEALNRLSEYEDTQLTPEICTEYKTFEDEAVSKNVTFKRIVELMEAESDGRLLTLPCKIGGKLWVCDRDGKPRKMILDPPDIRCHCAKEDNLCMAICDRPKTGICAFRLKNDGSSIGKTVFLSQEDAVTAEKENQNGSEK